MTDILVDECESSHLHWIHDYDAADKVSRNNSLYQRPRQFIYVLVVETFVADINHDQHILRKKKKCICVYMLIYSPLY